MLVLFINLKNTGQRYKPSRMIISTLEKLWRGREEGIRKEGVRKRQRERENEWEWERLLISCACYTRPAHAPEIWMKKAYCISDWIVLSGDFWLEVYERDLREKSAVNSQWFKLCSGAIFSLLDTQNNLRRDARNWKTIILDFLSTFSLIMISNHKESRYTLHVSCAKEKY